MQCSPQKWFVSLAVVVCLFSSCGTEVVDVGDETKEVTSNLAVGTVTSPVYFEALAVGWQDWSWANHTLTNTSVVAQGTRSIAARFAPWTGLYFWSNAFRTTGVTHVVMMVHGGSEYDGANLAVTAAWGNSFGKAVSLGAYCDGGKVRSNVWTSCRVPLAALGASGSVINGFVVQENAGRSFSTSAYFDVIGFGPGTVTQPADAGTGGGAPDAGGARDAGLADSGTSTDAGTDSGTPDAGTVGTPDAGQGPIVEPGSPGSADVTFTIRSDTARRAISPLIYGINDDARIAQVKQALVRAGGNRWTAYNWENNASNAGSDYCFQNDGQLSSSETPGEAVRTRIASATANGASALITVPIVDYVAADKNGNCDVRNSGPNYLQTRFRQNRSTKGSSLSTSPDKSDGYVYQDEFVNFVKGAVPSAQVVFTLDNEPDLWADTHAEVHPNALTYDELVSRNIDYAKAVKRVWPGALVTGFVSYGWAGYVNLQGAPDAAGKGDFTDYYLAQMKAAEAANGQRLIDYLDLHWYPEAKGDGVRIIGSSTSAGVVEARVQAPRSLWDETYTETSWIAQSSTQGPITLLPRMNAKIAAKYPGTRLAITEWNYGGGGHISGALATADTLGAFGREGVGLATMWRLNSSEAFTEAAFMAYRNFDGGGARFGDTSIQAVTNDRAAASVYASTDANNPGRVVIVAINKRTTPKTAALTVAAPGRFTLGQVFTITSAGAQPVAGPTIAAVSTNAFRYVIRFARKPGAASSQLEATLGFGDTFKRSAKESLDTTTNSPQTESASAK